ncbi:helix-turn-helix domain-containing protein [Actinomadura sp. K4S16]|uniref:helix-turn-helix domain-containing protein n=1 Tax=Actinomadura sp. K4S16 TaxID=1316147 RepID=UPI0035D025FA
MRSSGEFVSSLRHLKQRSGISYRQLERRAEAAGDTLPRSTIAQALTGETLPRRETVEAFVRACLGPEQAVTEAAQWLAVYDRLAGDGPPVHAMPPRRPSYWSTPGRFDHSRERPRAGRATGSGDTRSRCRPPCCSS